MEAQSKINIRDHSALRNTIDRLYAQTERAPLAKWAVDCIRHVLPAAGLTQQELDIIERGFEALALWQSGKASVATIRKAALNIHKAARQCQNPLFKYVLRAAGHAVACGHMKEHAMVCSDYLLKVIETKYPGCDEKIKSERKWQLETLKTIRLQGSVQQDPVNSVFVAAGKNR